VPHVKVPLASLIFTAASLAQTWIPQTSGVRVSLRGVSVVTDKVVWASGAEGVWLRTVDGGNNWKAGTVPGAETLDFRGVRGIDPNTAFLMSSGTGDKSRVYKTSDGGATWALLLSNPDAQGFFDALAFWDPEHGILMGDPVDGHAVVLVTVDGGRHWLRQATPAALPNEGAFAASNSCLVVREGLEAWFGTGGPGAGRVFHSRDAGKTWTVASTAIRNDGPGAGIFSLAFSDGRQGIAVGGEYAHDRETARNIVLTMDGGTTWTTAVPGSGPHGYRSAVAYLPDVRVWVASGTSGSDISRDGGKTWTQFDDGAFHALDALSSQAAWAVGPKGRIAKFRGMR